MARHVLDDRRDPFIQQAITDGAPQRGNHIGIQSQRPVADDVMGARYRDIDHRGAIDCNPQLDEIAAHQTGVGPRQGAGPIQIRLGGFRKDGGRRRVPPVWILEARYAPPLLIDQYRRVSPSDSFPKARNQGL